MSPTRELAIQTHKNALKLLYKTGLKCSVVYGGAKYWSQKKQFAQDGTDFLCATPGRLLHFIQDGAIMLNKIQHFILDEADTMITMGFEQSISDIFRCLDMTNKVQILMFSATFEGSMQKIAQKYLSSQYLFITVGIVGSTAKLVKQEIIQVQTYHKKTKCLELVKEKLSDGNDVKILIFVDKKVDAQNLELELAMHNIESMSIHGGRKQNEREHALSLFRTGSTPVLVATDVASRGLDIPKVTYVINYDLPRGHGGFQTYVHRVGRTGRCGNEGAAISFMNHLDSQLASALYKELKNAGQQPPPFLGALASGQRFTRKWDNNGNNNNNYYTGNQKFAATDNRQKTKNTQQSFSEWAKHKNDNNVDDDNDDSNNDDSNNDNNNSNDNSNNKNNNDPSVVMAVNPDNNGNNNINSKFNSNNNASFNDDDNDSFDDDNKVNPDKNIDTNNNKNKNNNNNDNDSDWDD